MLMLASETANHSVSPTIPGMSVNPEELNLKIHLFMLNYFIKSAGFHQIPFFNLCNFSISSLF